ncbi:MAG: hypothetical protein ABH956_00655 [Candidatus Nealsonbacteria bacterium]
MEKDNSKQENNLEEEKPKPILSQGEMKFPKVEIGMGAIFSPEALVMFSLAGILDIIGFLLLCFALDDLWILDTTGLILIGSWMFFRTGSIPTSKRLRQNKQNPTSEIKKKMGRKILKRLGLAFFIEAIPWIGGLVPSWTIAVYFELKNNPL